MDVHLARPSFVAPAGMPRAVGGAARLAAVVATVWIGFTLLIGAWRAAEAWVVVAGLGAFGVHSASRVGHQIVVTRADDSMFLANIGPLCASLGIVLLFGAIAVFAVSGDRRQRVRAFVRGAGIVVVCNLIRISSTVLMGLWKGPAALESFHDGLATGFAVVFVLTGCALFAFSLPPVSRSGRWPQLSRRRPGLR
ncbi:MAG: hypothetical protein JWN99_2049 [Ilumatobacteraceae bacterium]|nr:hypothetical protein [Ilumatobacteraceae bacterium]